MKSQPASTLQKASFVLLLLIAAALAYLIARERLRSDGSAQSVAGLGTNSDSEVPPIVVPAGMTSSFASLRPRRDAGKDTGTVPPVPDPRAQASATRTDAPTGVNDATSAATRGVALGTKGTSTAVAAGQGSGALGIAPSIVGRAVLRGTPPAERNIQLDAMCGRLHPNPMVTRHFVVDGSGALANVFVYIKEGAPVDDTPQSATPVFDNVNCVFEPYVLGLRAGQPFQLRNSDSVLHNMHFIPAPGTGNREINIGMPLKGMSVTKTFPEPEVFVKVKCDVHPWMFAYAGVVAHRWFAVTGPDGRFALPAGLPAGRYALAAVHQKAGEQAREIMVGGSEGEPVTFAFEAPAR